MSHDPTHQEHRPGGDDTPCGVVVHLPVRRADRSDGVPGHGRPADVRLADVLPADVHRGDASPGDGLLGDGSFTVDCAVCAHRDTPVCDDCVVSFIVGRESDDALVVDADEARAVRLLAHAGLVPGVRHEAQASGL